MSGDLISKTGGTTAQSINVAFPKQWQPQHWSVMTLLNKNDTRTQGFSMTAAKKDHFGKQVISDPFLGGSSQLVSG